MVILKRWPAHQAWRATAGTLVQPAGGHGFTQCKALSFPSHRAVQDDVAALWALLFRTTLGFFSFPPSPLSPFLLMLFWDLISITASTPQKVRRSCHHDVLKAPLSYPCHENFMTIHAIISQRCPSEPPLN